MADETLTVNDKLSKIDAQLPIPPMASAQQLGDLLGVTKQAIMKSDWWVKNRKGEKENEIGRRRVGHRKRAEGYDPDGRDDDV